MDLASGSKLEMYGAEQLSCDKMMAAHSYWMFMPNGFHRVFLLPNKNLLLV
jgi:hypothetical protein